MLPAGVTARSISTGSIIKLFPTVLLEIRFWEGIFKPSPAPIMDGPDGGLAKDALAT